MPSNKKNAKMPTNAADTTRRAGQAQVGAAHTNVSGAARTPNHWRDQRDGNINRADEEQHRHA